MAALETSVREPTRSRGERLVLVEHLLEQKQDAVPTLCSYLEDPRLRIRIIAAKTLAEAGDERAVEPLCRVMERSSGAAAPWLSNLIRIALLSLLGIVAASAVVAATALLIWSAWLFRGATFLFVVEILFLIRVAGSVIDERAVMRLPERWREWFARFGGHDLLVKHAADALAAISDRCLENSSRRSLPALRRISMDALHHSRETRQSALRAAARINFSTANCRHLPIAAVSPQLSAASLLLPAENPNGVGSP